MLQFYPTTEDREFSCRSIVTLTTLVKYKYSTIVIISHGVMIVMDIKVPHSSSPNIEKTADGKWNRAKDEFRLSFIETATFLRELADVIEKGGNIETDIAGQKIQVRPDEPITLEISYREDPKKKKMEIEFEIKEHYSASGKTSGKPSLG